MPSSSRSTRRAERSESIDAVETYEAIVKRLKKGKHVEFTIRRQNYLLTFTVKVQ